MPLFHGKPGIASIALAVFVSATAISLLWLNSGGAAGFRWEMKEIILKELADGAPPPPGEVVDVIYVLGGGQRSLEYKFNTAAELYKNQVADKIWILSRSGTTEFSPELGRNYTNDEWAIDRLQKFGVPEEKIEAIKIEEGFFGTLSEAKGISKALQERGCTSLLLVCQKYHMQRVYLSFKRHLPPEHVGFYIQNSSDDQRFYETIIELIKLKFYKHFFL